MQINNTLNATEVEKTIKQLSIRILERFPDSGLGKTCQDFLHFTQKNKDIITWIEKPNLIIRITVGLVVLLFLVSLIYSITLIDFTMTNSLIELTTVLESLLNNIIFIGAGIFFLYTLETRWKRGRAIQLLNGIRGFVHVVDMHQLTKDPQLSTKHLQPTEHSPERELSPFELQRYLDYCSEFFSLIGKVAALYSQSIPDEIVIQSSSEIESLCSNMSNKVWQKLSILNEMQ